MKITLAHGSGGNATSELIDNVFARYFSNPVLNEMEDAAVVEGGERLAITTDSFVVTPLFYPGGDIGRLCICGTVNDLCMRGAVPKYITCGFIIEEGAESEDLEKIADSMAKTAAEAGVIIVAGDTKVIEGKGGVYINTTGVGVVGSDIDISARNVKAGDAIIVSGNLGDHHATILSQRMQLTNDIVSDNAPLCEMVSKLTDDFDVHTLRDITRGGLGTVLNELAEASKVKMVIDAEKLPVKRDVRSFAKILGLDIMHMGNEGKLVLILPAEEAEDAISVIRGSRYGENAEIVGYVEEGEGVFLKTEVGGMRKVSVLIGEGLPRIC